MQVTPTQVWPWVLLRAASDACVAITELTPPKAVAKALSKNNAGSGLKTEAPEAEAMANGCVNKVTLVGNLGNDPDLRFTPRRTLVATCSLATTESWVDKAGKACERPEWHRLVMWRKLAETAKQHLKKGSRVYIEGKLNTRVWHDARGQKNSLTEVVVNSLKLLGAGQAHLDEPQPRFPQTVHFKTANRFELTFQ